MYVSVCNLVYDFGHLQTSLNLSSSFDNQFITDRIIKEKSPYMHIKDSNKKSGSKPDIFYFFEP